MGVVSHRWHCRAMLLHEIMKEERGEMRTKASIYSKFRRQRDEEELTKET